MKLKEIIENLGLEVVTGCSLDKEVTGGYTGDLLSNVMAGAGNGDLWLTIQGHQNVTAVALLTEVAAVVIVEGFEFEDKAVEKAREKGVNLLRTSLPAYELSGRLYKLGIG